MNDVINTAIPVVRVSFYTKYLKRFFDIIFSSSAILILSPILIIVAVLECVFHGRPIFFTQERPGKNGVIFKVYKFRSMNNKTDENGVLLPGNERLTRFGKIIRKLSIDELPQLFCILKGDMSILGPRPLLPQYLPLYSERHKMRHAVRPGFACKPLKPIKTWTWNDQFENDIYYVENCSFLLDVQMLFAVARAAIIGESYRANDTREEFNGSNLFYDSKNHYN